MGRPIESSGATEPPTYLKDRYRLGKRLGEGSMGIIYGAHDDTLDRDVAIKFLLPERVAGGEASARFLREARAVARLSHPNIMTLYDVDREREWHYLVLEHIPGQNLHTMMVESEDPLPLGTTLRAIRGALAALAYAHAQGVVHRDIKPENIMVTPDGRVKVTDFGLALARGDVRVTRDGMIVGTVLYVAPELIAGEPSDRRADLYAVGAVLYELLTGRPPFTGDDPMAVMSQILNAPVTPPRVLDPSIPEQVEHVVLRLLAKDSAKRPATAEDVLAALPTPEQAKADEAEQTPTERTSLSLLERIVRRSSTAYLRPERTPAPIPDKQTARLAKAPTQMGELLVYAALEDTAAAVEAERRRLAALLKSSVVEPLNLLLSQANAYEQTLGANPSARMAVAVLTSLARQVLQQVRDLEANLYPTILETLGLESALEALVSQTMRNHGLHITLYLERMRERLPPQVELVLFRTAQEALERVIRHAHASQATIRLEHREESLVFSLSDNGLADASVAGEALRAVRRRIEQLGGAVELQSGPYGGSELKIRFRIAPAVELTPREMEVIRLLTAGLSNKEMAGLLSISPRTVNFHLDNIYSKLGVSSRTEAAIYALRQGWVGLQPQ